MVVLLVVAVAAMMVVKVVVIIVIAAVAAMVVVVVATVVVVVDRHMYHVSELFAKYFKVEKSSGFQSSTNCATVQRTSIQTYDNS
jgi:hypothetical protein